MSDTIFALSSGKLPSGVAVVRVSGSRAGDVIRSLAGDLSEPRQAVLRVLRSPDGAILDRALVLFFAGPRSATGEDCAEFHLHGGRAVVAKALAVLGEMPGMRHAEPGEFTQRGFLNGKLDLVQAEALGDLINSETEAQRRFAIDNAGAGQSALYASWRKRLLYARAMIEAELDFSDEGDVPGSVAAAVWIDIANLRDEMEKHIGGFGRAEIIRDGFRVVLAGPPNAGKSSLLNALAKRDVAIVSDEPGTTRDVLEVTLNLDGYKVILADTAGIRDVATGVEALGIERTRERVRDAHMVLELHAAGEWFGEFLASGPQHILISSKADLLDGNTKPDGLALSVRTGQGIDDLLDRVAQAARVSAELDGDVLPSRERHVALFRSGIGHLMNALDSDVDLELRAEALRLTDGCVGRVIGAVDVEDLLGVVFSQFCIGK